MKPIVEQDFTLHPAGNAQNKSNSVRLVKEEVEQFLSSLEQKGRVSGTIDLYRRKLKYLYDALPEDKLIYRGTLRDWRKKLLDNGYAADTVNGFITAANKYLEYIDAREFQLVGLLKSDELQPELSRAEYLRLLQTAKMLGRERTYLLVKLFGNSEMPVQELPKLTVEAVREGRVQVTSNRIKQGIRFPDCLQKELLAYIDRNGITSGPIFLTRNGEPMSRSNVNTGISQLCEAARVPVERGTPRALRKMYRSMQDSMEQNIRLIVEQAQERLLEEEQLTVGWEDR